MYARGRRDTTWEMLIFFISNEWLKHIFSQEFRVIALPQKMLLIKEEQFVSLQKLYQSIRGNIAS